MAIFLCRCRQLHASAARARAGNADFSSYRIAKIRMRTLWGRGAIGGERPGWHFPLLMLSRATPIAVRRKCTFTLGSFPSVISASPDSSARVRRLFFDAAASISFAYRHRSSTWIPARRVFPRVDGVACRHFEMRIFQPQVRTYYAAGPHVTYPRIAHAFPAMREYNPGADVTPNAPLRPPVPGRTVSDRFYFPPVLYNSEPLLASGYAV